jgi:long-chain acyl-CoA synthetase
MFFNTVREFGGRPAQMFKQDGAFTSITYAEFGQIVEEMACGLMSMGINNGDFVCLMARTGPTWGWADYAILTEGAVTVSVYPTLSAEELVYIGNHTGARYIMAGDAEVLERVKTALPEIPSIEAVIVMDPSFTESQPGVVTLGELREKGRKFKEERPDAYRERWTSLTGADPCTVIYTSGTMGNLKGSLLDHATLKGALSRSLRHLDEGGFSCCCEDVAFSILPLAHVWERNNSYLAMLSTGGCTGYGEKPTTLLQDIQAVKPTWVLLVPRLWDRIFSGIRGMLSGTAEGRDKFEWALAVGQEVLDKRTGPTGAVDLTSDPTEGLDPQLKADFEKADAEIFSVLRNALGGRLKIAYSGGALLPAELHRSYLSMNFPLLNGWGLTETAAGINHGRPNATKIGWLSTMVPGVEAKLEDDGEILVRGVGCTTEYFRNAEETAAAFTPDGWFRTGDIGEFDAEGFLRIVDRKKYIIVLDTGKNVAPARIESKFTNSPVVEQVVVVGDSRKYISALIVPAYDYILYVFKDKGIAVDESQLAYDNINGIDTCISVGADVAEHPLLRELVDKEVERVNRQLDGFETVKRFYILPRKLTEATGELTPTLKIKNRVVFANFADEIEMLYR